MIEAQDVVIEVRGKRLLDGVNVHARPGELVCLLGPNGAGKSTLLSVLSGERRPSEGRVLFDGKPLASVEPRALARRRAVLPQALPMPFAFTALEVVLLGRTPHVAFRETAHDVDIARRALAEARAEALADRRYPTLSGGEQQRVQLARTLAQVWEPGDAPRALLLDEPTSALDPAHQHVCLEATRRFVDAGNVGIMILHDLTLAAAYADRVVLLEGGRVLDDGPPQDVLTPEGLLRAFSVRARVLPVGPGGAPVVVTLGMETGG